MIAALVTAALLMPASLGKAAPPPQRTGSAPPARVQFGVRVSPDTVTVGDPFTVTVRVRAPRGASIVFPAGPDSAATVELVDPRVVRTAADTLAMEQLASYRLVAWDTGQVRAALSEVRVVSGGATRRIPLAGVAVYVRSVLPADTALRTPRPARDILVAPPPWWRWLVLAALILAALLVIGLLAWLWRRRRRPAVEEDPLARAEREFARLDTLGLLEVGEPGRYVALNVDVMRAYLAARLPLAERSLTSGELIRALRAHVPAGVPTDRLSALVEEADLIKFARRTVSPDAARHLAADARSIVRDTHDSIRAAEAAAAAHEREAAA